MTNTVLAKYYKQYNSQKMSGIKTKIVFGEKMEAIHIQQKAWKYGKQTLISKYEATTTK